MKYATSEQAQGFRWECAVSGRSADPEGVFATHRVLAGIDPEVYVSAAAAKEMARELGWHSPADIEELVTKAREMATEIESLKSLLEKVETMQRLEAEVAEAVAV